MSTSLKRLKINDSFLLESNVFSDKRGAFEEMWSLSFFNLQELNFQPCSACHSLNLKRDTIRAFHFQDNPYQQAKIISCVSGSIWDVVLDLRQSSSTFLKWDSVNLVAWSGRSVYIPKGCAHGYVSLEDNTIVSYLIEGEYNAKYSRSINWNDPTLSVPWPTRSPILSDKDNLALSVEDYLRNNP